MHYFYKIRDRPIGPLDLQKMQDLARRARISHKTPVSTDGQTWQPASDFPEVFTKPALPPPVRVEPAKTDHQTSPPTSVTPASHHRPAGGGLATTRFCSHCGAGITEAAVVCLSCGAACGTGLSPSGGVGQASIPLNGITNPNAMNPAAAAILGLCCLPGLSQMMLGQVGKGLIFLLAGFLLPLVTNVIAGIDAYQIARKLKDGKTVGQWEFF